MRRLLVALMAMLLLPQAQLAAREVVYASEPESLAVTIYRDPDRYESQRINRNNPRGFAMISETRTVTLPAGESTIRFDGVAEGMVAVSAIVTGLPGGTIEKNRNADLLSPAALVDGTLGNRVRITRTNPGTGVPTSEEAIVRTRADGGLVLQTSQGYEAVRCAGLPEKLTFDRVPGGLSARPVFSIDTRDPNGGTYQIVLTYISWGFDWKAHYVGTLKEGGVQGEVGLKLLSWLTVLNDNGQSFPDAELLVVAGKLNVDSNYQGLSDPPTGQPLRLQCYPLGNTKRGDPVPSYRDRALFGSRPPPPPPMMAPAPITVTASRREAEMMDSAVAVVAGEEQLGDLKLFRVPEPMTVAANGMKQVAFLNKDKVRGEFFYIARCEPYSRYYEPEDIGDYDSTRLMLFMKNEKDRGLGQSLPMGGFTLFEPGSAGTQLVAELDMRDYAVGQDVELGLGDSNLVFSQCSRVTAENPDKTPGKWTKMRAQLSNANNAPVKVRMLIGSAGEYDVRWPRKRTKIKDGNIVVEVTIPANSTKSFDWKLRHSDAYFSDEE